MSKLLYGYVGGKTRLKPRILEALSRFRKAPYREPFFGGGAIGIHMMEWWGRDVWVNDKDIGIHCIWQSVKRFPAQLKALVRDFKPSYERFRELREFLWTDLDSKTEEDILRVGFSKLAAHKLSYGTLGVMASSARCADENMSRCWMPDNICQRIDDLHPWFKRKDVRLTRADYSKLITDESKPALLYLDPPYFEQGANCYQHSFRYADHIRLSELLKKTNHDWVLSYDDNQTIHRLYEGWSKITRVSTHYSVAGHRTGTELLISSARG